jgi:DNA-binding response OmpR family regulator
VTLPLSSQVEPLTLPTAQFKAPPFSSPTRRILLVDDNRDALDSLAALLQLNGHDVRTAGDPIRAMALAAEFDAEIAILDIGLPGMDGYELGARLRAEGSGCRLVALTGYGLAEDRAKSQVCGFEKHFVKPIDSDALLAFLAD